MCYFIQKAHSPEQTHIMRVFTSGTHLSAEMTEAMWIKCFAQGQNILMQPGFEPPIAAPQNRHHIHMTNILQKW